MRYSRASVLVSIFLLEAAARADVQTASQRACLNGLNAAGARVAAAVATDMSRCVAAAIRDQLPPGQTAQQCLSADNRGRVAAAAAKTVAVEAGKCAVIPDFGAATAAAVNGNFQSLVPVQAIFGTDLDAAAAAARNSTNARAVGCQAAVARASAKLLTKRVKAFNTCKRRGLARGAITDVATLAACWNADPNGKLAAAATRFSAKVERSCAGVDVASLFPGQCATQPPAELGACIEAYLDCNACLAVIGADGLPNVCSRFVDGVAQPYCGAPPSTNQSVARQWDEEALAAIRIDFPRPPIHARNLFHLSVAMWDAWAAYDATADGYLVAEKPASSDPEADRAAAISFAAHRVLAARYAISPNASNSLAAFEVRMRSLGYDPDYTSTSGSAPAALGNRIAAAVLAYGLGDGSYEADDYADPVYAPVNDPLVVKLPGASMFDPNRWQPLALDVVIGQNGIPIPDKIQRFVAPQWGSVFPFAVNFAAVLPGPPPRLNDPVTDTDFKQQALEVLRFASRLTPDDGVTMDISPASLGNNPLGTNAGTGYVLNPVTGLPYTPQIVERGDFGRVLAEFWADGPTSETPPGHWNTIANYVSDHPSIQKRIGGSGPVVNDLEWDVKLYLALNGAVHDAAVGAWGTKRVYDSVRPISMIRYMGGLGQSSDPLGPSYDPDGLPLEPGLVEVITAASSAPGQRHQSLAAYVGEIAVYSWPGEPSDPTTQYSGARWVRAEGWVPYQRKTFVTPPFAGYVSGHSTFSRAAAEVLTRLTGSPYFPGGLGEFTAPQNTFLKFEIGPTQPVTMQWASYYDAADQAGISRLWGGIHIAADDFNGRIMGATIGNDAYDKAILYWDGGAVP